MYWVNTTTSGKVMVGSEIRFSPAHHRMLAMQTVPTISMAASSTAS